MDIWKYIEAGKNNGFITFYSNWFIINILAVNVFKRS